MNDNVRMIYEEFLKHNDKELGELFYDILLDQSGLEKAW